MCRWSVHVVLLGSSLVACACPDPTPPAPPEPLASAPQPICEPAPAPEPEPEPEPAPPLCGEEASQRREWTSYRCAYNELGIFARVFEDRERSDEDGWPLGFVEVEIERPDIGPERYEFAADFGQCNVEAIELWVDVLYSDEERVIFELRHRCIMGADRMRISVEHLVLDAEYGYGGLNEVYAGSSTMIDNRGLAADIDKLELHVEGDDLAVYRHTVAWCDPKGLKELTGYGSCPQAKRKLKLVERIPL